MNGVDLFLWAWVFVAFVFVVCGAYRLFRDVVHRSGYRLSVPTNYYTDAATYHRKPVTGSHGHRHYDGHSGPVLGDSGPRTIYRPNVGDRPIVVASDGDSRSSDAETMK